jgi:hypothetical protein
MIRAIFRSYAATDLSQAIRHSSWAFAVIEMFHLLALALLGGGLLVAAIGLSGWGFQFPGRSDGWRGLRRFLTWALAATVLSGLLLVGSNPMKYYFNDAFRIKMLILIAGLGVGAATEIFVSRRWLSFAAVGSFASVAAWLGVALAGRLIGLL